MMLKGDTSKQKVRDDEMQARGSSPTVGSIHSLFLGQMWATKGVREMQRPLVTVTDQVSPPLPYRHTYRRRERALSKGDLDSRTVMTLVTGACGVSNPGIDPLSSCLLAF